MSATLRSAAYADDTLLCAEDTDTKQVPESVTREDNKRTPLAGLRLAGEGPWAAQKCQVNL